MKTGNENWMWVENESWASGLDAKDYPVAHGHQTVSVGHLLSSSTGPKWPVDFHILCIYIILGKQ